MPTGMNSRRETSPRGRAGLSCRITRASPGGLLEASVPLYRRRLGLTPTPDDVSWVRGLHSRTRVVAFVATPAELPRAEVLAAGGRRHSVRGSSTHRRPRVTLRTCRPPVRVYRHLGLRDRSGRRRVRRMRTRHTSGETNVERVHASLVKPQTAGNWPRQWGKVIQWPKTFRALVRWSRLASGGAERHAR